MGVVRMSSRLVTQKHKEIVNNHPMIPDTKTATCMAKGPSAAASCVSSDMLIGICSQFRDIAYTG